MTHKRSEGMEALHFEDVVGPVWRHPETDWDKNLSKGLPIGYICQRVLRRGLADFSVGHEDLEHGCSLSADDKVLLYCFVNMTQHFFEALATFKAFREGVEKHFALRKNRIMLDLGSGPGTAALAMADFIPGFKMGYVGVECAKAMRMKAKTMVQSAHERGLLDKGPVEMLPSLGKAIQFAKRLDFSTNVLVNATYFFASTSLDVQEVVDLVTALKQNDSVRHLSLTYSNSTMPQAGAKFQKFKELLKDEFSSDGGEEVSLSFLKKLKALKPTECRYSREFLLFKE